MNELEKQAVKAFISSQFFCFPFNMNVGHCIRCMQVEKNNKKEVIVIFSPSIMPSKRVINILKMWQSQGKDSGTHSENHKGCPSPAVLCASGWRAKHFLRLKEYLSYLGIEGTDA